MHIENTDPDENPFLEAALELVWPTRCSGCERLGSLLCESCEAALLYIRHEYACAFCGAPFGRLNCTGCYTREGRVERLFSAGVSALELDELSGRVIVRYKDNNEQRLSRILARCLLFAIPPSWLDWADVLTWIPSDRKALRRRGFDHMGRVARDLEREVGLPARRLLDKSLSRDQRGLNRQERSENLQKSFSLHRTALPHEEASLCKGAPQCETAQLLPPHILLVDDVFTTGCTLDAASAKLKEGGASEVRVATVTRAW